MNVNHWLHIATPALPDDVEAKIASAVYTNSNDRLSPVRQLVVALMAQAWDECAQEAHGLGWMHDFAKSDAIGRNPYRTLGSGEPT